MLEPCCAELESLVTRIQCEDVLEDAEVQLCMQALPEYCASMMPTTPAAASCTSLQACCESQTDADDREDCDELVEEADDRDCMRATQVFCESAEMPDMDSCRRLRLCCIRLDDADRTSCDSVVEAADPAACVEASARLCP